MRRYSDDVVRLLAAVVAIVWGAGGQAAGGPAVGLLDDAPTGPGWPCWRGPYHCGAAAESNRDLVDDLSRAKLVWQSDEAIPGARCADGRKVVSPAEGQISGGFASPVYADGRVYITYYVPNGEGDLYDHRLYAKHAAAGGFGKEKWWIDTDDVIHCFDARTGRTLWKRVFAGRGMNYNLFNKGGPCNLTACVADGRVYAIGSAGRVYCVDAATGGPVWESDVGERALRQEALRKVCKEKREIPQYNRDMASSPIVVDGVVVCSDFLGYKVQQPVREYFWGEECGLVGLDADTGRRLWSIRQALGNWASPVRWDPVPSPIADPAAERSYVIAASGQGKVRCIEPRTGRVVWDLEAGKNGHTVGVAVDLLVCNGGTETDQLVCYQISTKGARKKWELPAAYGYVGGTPPLLYWGHVYARCKGGKLVCVELTTGKVAGSIDFPGGMGFLVAMDGRILLDADDSHDTDAIYMFDANPPTFRQLGPVWGAPNATGYMAPVTPAAAGGRLYMRGLDRILCYDLRAPR